MKIGLVCSNGGHLFQLSQLRQWWNKYERFWSTFNKLDADFILKGEKVYYGYCPTNRNLKNFIRNIFLAWKILRKEKPDVIISTGAGLAVPFFYIGKVLGIKLIYIESFTRIRELSLTGKIVYPLADSFLVQWEELTRLYPRVTYIGSLL